MASRGRAMGIWLCPARGFVAAALVFGGVAVTARAAGAEVAPPGTTPAVVRTVAGTMELHGIACPTASICEAVGENPSNQGVVVAVANGVPGAVQVVPGAPILDAVACPTATLCEAVGTDIAGDGVVVQIVDGSPTSVQPVVAGLLAVACSSAEVCLAVGQSAAGSGVVVPIAAGVPGSVQIVAGTEQLVDTSCPTASTCEVVGHAYNAGVVVTVTNGTAGAAQPVNHSEEFTGIACPTTVQCWAVGADSYGGVLEAVNNGVPAVPSPVAGTVDLGRIACPTASNCQVTVSVPGEYGSFIDILANGTLEPLAPVRDVFVSAIACPTSTVCEASGIEGSAPQSVGVVAGIDPAGIIAPATFTYPLDGDSTVDTLYPFTWTDIPQAQAYDLIVGTTPDGSDLVTSGPLPASASDFMGPALPVGPLLYATLLVEVAGVWTVHDAVGFNAVPGEGTFTYPVDGQGQVDSTQAFTWSTIAAAGGYYLTVGTTPLGADVVNSGPIYLFTQSYPMPDLPTGRTLYATLYTAINGVYSRKQTISFSAAPGKATFTSPLNGQNGVDPTKALIWAPIPHGQGYIVVVGTRMFGSDVASSAVLPAGSTSYQPAVLPTGRTLYATILTEVNGSFTRYQSVAFTTGPARGNLTRPLNGQLNVATPTTFTWSTIAAAQNYDLVVGTSLYGSDLVSSGVLTSSQSSFPIPILPSGRVLYATLLTRVNGVWTFQSVTFTAA